MNWTESHSPKMRARATNRRRNCPQCRGPQDGPFLRGADRVTAAVLVTKLQKLQRLQVLSGSLCPFGVPPCAVANSGALDFCGLPAGCLSPAVPCFLRYRGPRKPAWIKAVPYVPCVPCRKSGWPNFAGCCAGSLRNGITRFGALPHPWGRVKSPGLQGLRPSGFPNFCVRKFQGVGVSVDGG